MKPPRPRMRLSLRASLALVAAVALGLGSWCATARAQRDAVDGLRAISPHGTFVDSDVDERGCVIGVTAQDPPRWVPRWAYDLLGPDSFRTVTMVELEGLEDATPGERAEVVGHLARLRHLKFLMISIPVDDVDVARLAHLTGLKQLAFEAPCPGLTDRSAPILGGFGQLDWLYIAGSAITDVGLAGLGRLDRLESLRIGPSPITDVGVAALGRLPRLADLTLGWPVDDATNPRDDGMPMTGRVPVGPGQFSALRKLAIRCRVPAGGGLALVGTMPGLAKLRLAGPSNRDDDLGPLAALRQLESFDLRDATVAGPGLRHLAGLGRLAQVELTGPDLGDAALPALARLPALAGLDLIQTGMTAAGLEQLRPAPRHTSLDVSPPIPGDRARLAAVLPRCDLHRSIQPH